MKTLSRVTASLASIGLLLAVATFSATAASAVAMTPEASSAATSSPVDAPQAAAAGDPVSVVGQPLLGITPDTCEATTKIVSWDIPIGLAIGGVTGKGESVDEEAVILSAATTGTSRPRSWVLPVTVLDGFTYSGPATITLTQARQCAEPTASPTSGATAPLPSPSAAAPVVAPGPAVVAARQDPAADPALVTSTAGGTSGSHDDELAYTGLDSSAMFGGVAAALLLMGMGSVLLAKRRQIRI